MVEEATQNRGLFKLSGHNCMEKNYIPMEDSKIRRGLTSSLLLPMQSRLESKLHNKQEYYLQLWLILKYPA